jgi:hypothetical protein
VGIDYSDYFNAGSNLIINIGEPIRVEDYLADYRENEQKTINQLMNKLRDGLENVMVHIPEKQYGSLLQICELYASAKQVQAAGKPYHYRYFLTVKELGKKLGTAIEQYPEKVEPVIRTADEWQSVTTSAGLAGQKTIVTAPKTGNLLLRLLLAFFALPFFMAGSAGNILPYLLASKLGSNARDPHFKSSIKFGAGLFIFPIYYVILILITSLMFNNWLIATALITGLAALGIFAYYMRQFYLKLLTQLKIMRLKKRDHLAYNSIVKLQAELLNGVEAILKTTESR